MNRQKAIIAIAVALLGAFALAAYLYRASAEREVERTIEENPSLVVRSSAKTIGPSDARVHIVEFMDPGCETCRVFHPLVKQLVEEHAGKVKVSIRYLPLHEGADTMVKILEAAERQGKYWETLELMFASQPMWASHHHPQPDRIWPLLAQMGLDVEAIRRDMNDPAIAAVLEDDLAAARALGLRKTPSFFVNDEPLQQFGLEQLRALVAQAVAAQY